MTIKTNSFLRIPQGNDALLQREGEYTTGEMVEGSLGTFHIMSKSRVSSYYVVFNDEISRISHQELGPDWQRGYPAGGWFFAGLEGKKSPIIDAMYIYPNNLTCCKEYRIEIIWSEDGLKAGLLIDCQLHAVFDFENRNGYCRTGAARTGTYGFKLNHRWSDNALKPFVKNPDAITVPPEDPSTKEKQKQFIKTYLKSTLKQWGYQTSGNSWWKDKGNFLICIYLVNSPFNYAGQVSFSFEIGASPKKDNASKKLNRRDYYFHIFYENKFMSPERLVHKFRTRGSINMDEKTNLSEFIAEMKIDFECEILPNLEKLQTINDWISFYENLFKDHLPADQVARYLKETLKKKQQSLTDS